MTNLVYGIATGLAIGAYVLALIIAYQLQHLRERVDKLESRHKEETRG